MLLNVCLEQVQSIDYTGDEVQVTTTDGIGYSVQKVGAGVPLRIEHRATKGHLCHQAVCPWSLPRDLLVSNEAGLLTSRE